MTCMRPPALCPAYQFFLLEMNSRKIQVYICNVKLNETKLAFRWTWRHEFLENSGYYGFDKEVSVLNWLPFMNCICLPALRKAYPFLIANEYLKNIFKFITPLICVNLRDFMTCMRPPALCPLT